MGGQACILYGAAEFSRDIDIAVAAEPENLDLLRRALADLDARQVFLPALDRDLLLRGHACHFRCHAAEVEGLRINVMSVMRGVAPFEELWERRREIRLRSAGTVRIMALPDLVQAKKTQRDKDWPVVRRLVEADVTTGGRTRSPARRAFWLRECRSPDLLLELVSRYPSLARRLRSVRPALAAAERHDRTAVERSLRDEEEREREADRRYWAPLRAELETWRRERFREG